MSFPLRGLRSRTCLRQSSRTRLGQNCLQRTVAHVWQVANWKRTTAITVLLASAALTGGCINMREKQTVSAFQKGLEAGDLTVLKEKSTPRFAAEALRHPEADESLSQLKIPDGKYKVVEVIEVSDTEKKVTLGFGEKQRQKIQYRLVKNEADKSWKVDDIYLRQRAGDKKVAMAVTEQMDVLLSAREFYDAWTSSDRSRVFSKSHREMAEGLQKMPPAILAANITRIMGPAERSRSFRPEAHISGDEAVVRLNRSHGTLVMSMEKNDGGWQVKDLGLDARNDETSVPSLMKTVQMTNRAMDFLTAWNANDKPALKQVTQERFYSAGLAPANLNDLPLPSPDAVAANVEVNLLETHADVIVNDTDRTIRITLSETEARSNEFQISDVAIYDLNNGQTLSLSSVLTARPVAELFVQALQVRDPKMLEYASTVDLHKKTWNRVDDQTLGLIPFPIDVAGRQWDFASTRFDGDVTHVLFESGDQMLTVVMHEQNGKVLVDDLHFAHRASTDDAAMDQQQPESLKHYLAGITPVYELASRIHHNDPDSTVRLVTDDFYDRVFSLTQTMPQTSYQFLDYVSSGRPKVKQIEDHDGDNSPRGMVATMIQPNQPKVARYVPKGGQTIVEFNTPTGTMQVSLREEQGLLRIDDASVLSPQNEIVMRLKQNMRMELASNRTQNLIRTVSGEVMTNQNRPPVAGAIANSPARTPNAATDELSLQNAYYEEFRTDRPQAVQHTNNSQAIPQSPGIPPARLRTQQPLQPTPHPSAQPNDAGSLDAGQADSNQPLQPPQKFNAPPHLLLKPIPIQ